MLELLDDPRHGALVREPSTKFVVSGSLVVARGGWTVEDLVAAGPYLYFTTAGRGGKTVIRQTKYGRTAVVLARHGAGGELGILGDCVIYSTVDGIWSVLR